MKNINKIFLVGRLGNNPVRRETKAGLAVTHFSVATSRRIKTEDGKGEPEEKTQWHRVVAWGRDAENCANYLRKGSPVVIEGNLRSREYDAKDGTRKMAFEVHVDEISFVGGRTEPAAEPMAAEA